VGLGQCGIITKVVMRLMDAPTNVLFIKMDYDDFQSASADLALLAKDGRFHHLDAAVLAGRLVALESCQRMSGASSGWTIAASSAASCTC
jgi:FAD/FMN-containing dehydrogenase